MEQSKIDRINELARKAKSGQPLTAEEMAEREELRAEYLQAVRTHMANVLEHTVIQYPDGRRERCAPRRRLPPYRRTRRSRWFARHLRRAVSRCAWFRTA